MSCPVFDEVIGYVTLEEAKQYAELYYQDLPEYGEWLSHSVNTERRLLMRAFQTIEMLPFTGRKLNPDQKTAFPRWPCSEVPEAVKHAQIELALSQGISANVEEAQHYEKLWTYGVESYSIGNLSESVSSGSYGLRGARSTGVTSPVAERLLRPYLSGGYRI